MDVRFTYEDRDGSTHFKGWALPLIVGAICVPIVVAFSAGSQGAAIGAATAFLVASVVIIAAVRSRPFGAMEVAKSEHPGHRVLLLTAIELGDGPAERVIELVAGAEDVRILVPVSSRRIDRWLSAEDGARAGAQARLATTAGILTAAGLRVSGSVGDSDTLQAVEDELRSFAADEVLVVAGPRHDAEIEQLRHRLALPLTRVSS
ncbi:MAG: hypothetical protein ABR536_06420 [Solirubrobacterales bacterium]